MFGETFACAILALLTYVHQTIRLEDKPFQAENVNNTEAQPGK
jgi:hypothetical protein